MILFFSGTGNSKFLAQKLGHILEDKVVDLFSYIKESKKGNFHSEKPFVLVCPTYGWRVPRFLSAYIKKANFSGNKNFYLLMNFGSSAGNSQKYIKKDLEPVGLNYKGLYGIQMPENNLMLFDLDSDQTNRKIIKKAENEIKRAGAYIKNGEDFPRKKVSLLDRFYSSLVNDIFFKFIVKVKKFYHTDKCTKCGVCQKVCVLNNITYKDGFPVRNGNCTHCAACLSKCPYGAIEYGKKTVGKDRYLLSKLINTKE